jgi:hypothetical protein
MYIVPTMTCIVLQSVIAISAANQPTALVLFFLPIIFNLTLQFLQICNFVKFVMASYVWCEVNINFILLLSLYFASCVLHRVFCIVCNVCNLCVRMCMQIRGVAG